MKEFSRADRVGAQMQRELALLLRDEAKNPRLAEVTIQEVRVTRDLSHAKVYFTVLDSEEAPLFTEMLGHAAGFLRKRLGQIMKLRTVPELHFVYDRSIEEGQRLSALIEKAVASDRREDEDGQA
ncbi:MAG TPA: 30S ribosome-binding factor RbfA [Thiolapillus brandeum]|uniref:Ribosome-binding factor A n=1 Tax=Thiolapillus brandeum TaxID=1076588 RepID=A0A7C5J038_9GAMM|nr:30S ribosome-binding factor RbfA [Thiolapillus brandeum]